MFYISVKVFIAICFSPINISPQNEVSFSVAFSSFYRSTFLLRLSDSWALFVWFQHLLFILRLCRTANIWWHETFKQHEHICFRNGASLKTPLLFELITVMSIHTYIIFFTMKLIHTCFMYMYTKNILSENHTRN